MVSIGDHGGGVVRSPEDNSTSDYPTENYHPPDLQCSPLSSPGERSGYSVDVYTQTNTVVYEDTVPVEDVAETQIVAYGNETQVVDDLDVLRSTETQVIDEFSDRDSVDTDGEISDTTEVLGDDDDVSDDEYAGGGKVEAAVGEEVQWPSYDDSEEKRFVDQSIDLSHQQSSSASVPRFVSACTEALQASPLAARRNSLKQSSNGSCSSEQLCSGNIIETSGCDEFINESDVGGQKKIEKELENGIKSTVNSSTVGMPFIVGSTTKDDSLCCTSSIAETKGVTQSPTIDEELARLSYVDSQEPGEASQADALALVEKLIDETKASFENGVNLENSSRREIDSISAAKGPQSLAKKIINRGIGGRNGVFDWDNGLEDERGGDFFIRRKEDLYPGKEPLGCHATPSTGRLNTRNACKGNQGNSGADNQVAVHSNSKIVIQKLNVTDTETSRTLRNSRKDLIGEFDEHANRNESGGPSESTIPSDIPDAVGLDTQLAADAMEELLNGDPISNFDCETTIPSDIPDVVGLDTQLAADAMEELLNGDPISNFDCDNTKQKHLVQQSPIRKAKRRVSSKQCAYNNNHEAEVDKMQSKKLKRSDAVSTNQTGTSTRKYSGKAGLECDAFPRLTTRIVRSDSDKFSNARGSKTGRKLPSKTDEPENRGSIQGIQLDVLNKCNEPALRRGRTVKKQQESAGRTRKSCVVSSLRIAEDVHIDVDEYKDCTREHPDCEQSPARIFGGESAETLNIEGKSSELTSRKSGVPDSLKLNLMAVINHKSFPRKRRSTRSMSEKPKDHNDLDSHIGNSRRSLRPRMASTDVTGARLDDTSHTGKSLLAEKEVDVMPPMLRDLVIQPSISTFASPVGYATPTNSASPICTAKGLSKKNLATSSLKRKSNNLCTVELTPVSEVKDLRKRRDLADIRVLFSHHLHEDVIKRQKKIVDRLKVSTASSIMDATHFVTDSFVRTRNMLEAIASGKPIVTPLWLEQVGRAKYYIDEQKYIMRDAKKEKELGFNMAVSLADARQRPLLQGRRVLITENAKPSKEILSGLVKAVDGKPIEEVDKSVLKDDTLTELLVLSSDEDYKVCIPFLERGAAVYSSELLLNGIVTRKLEYDRHRLFVGHERRTSSTKSLKKMIGAVSSL